MESMSECPVCGGHVTSSSLNMHMSSHAKEDIVAALLRQRQVNLEPQVGLPPTQFGNISDLSAFARSGVIQGPSVATSSSSFNPGQLGSLLKKDGNQLTSQGSSAMHTPFDLSIMPSSNNTAGPFIMPQMMGMMQVISPCFIPQPNGPPILVNLPSYIYPNIGMMGGMLAAASNSPASASLLSNATTSTLLSPTTVTNSGVSFIPTPTTSNSATSSGITFLQTSASSSGPVTSLPANLLPLHPVSFASPSASSTLDTLVEVVLSPPPLASASLGNTTIVMDLGSGSEDSIISVEDHKPVHVQQTQQFLQSQPGPSGLSVHKGLPKKLIPKLNTRENSGTNSKSNSTVPSEICEQSADTITKEITAPLTTSTATGVYGYTRYASDSPYPAASINFASVLNLDDQQQLKQESGEKQVEKILPEVDQLDEQELELENEQLDNALLSNEIQSIKDDEENSNNSTGYEGSNVCTVHTVADLQNALKSEEDIQIVVPNELLETIEFKTFLANLGPFPITSASAISASELNQPEERTCHAPPNTPSVTRPPSTSPHSPQPCSSRDITQTGFKDQTEPKYESDNSDGGDDITLQDLVAMETMEDDICDEEQFYQMSSNSCHIEPFASSIFYGYEEEENSNIFSCHKCGLHFSTFTEFDRHRTDCSKRKVTKGVGKKSSKKSPKKSSTVTAAVTVQPIPNEILGLDDSNANLDPLSSNKAWTSSSNLLNLDTIKSEQSSLLSSSDLIRQNSNSVSATKVKSETFDSSSQPALAAPGVNHWKCNQCRVVFETGPLLWQHLDSMHRAANKCTVCHVTFEDRKQALVHRKKFHPSLAKVKLEPPELIIPNENGEFVCVKCDRAFKDRDLLTKHQACHDEEKPYECLECGKKFSKSSLLRNHRRRHFEVGAFECQLCKKRFYTPNKLREHERVHTREAPLSCNVCGKTFRRHSNLSEHKRIHLEVRPVKPPKELFCHCGKVFPTQRDLDWHKEGEHDNIPKKCTFCGEIFVHSSSLTRHVRLKHEADFMPTDKKTSLYAKCPICQQTFYKTSINKHIRIKHDGQKPFKCDICKMSFVTKCNLMNHAWQHKGVRARPFKCTTCNKSYLRQSLLDAHMRSHKGVKPYVCNECGLQFANKSNWQRHVAEHSGSRNYPCHLCDKRFSRNYYLSDHLKTHTGEKPFVCGICGKSAATRSNYNSHLRTHITREPVNSEV